MEESTRTVLRNHPKGDVIFHRAPRLEEPLVFDKKKHSLTGWLLSVKQYAQQAGFYGNTAIFVACNKPGYKIPRVYH